MVTPAPVPGVYGRAATALGIDDETAVRQIVRRMLEPDLCRVVDVPDAESGLPVVEAGTPPLDLVLTNLKMPGLDGRDVVEILTAYCPELPVVVMSGFADASTGVGINRAAVQVLPKPFTAEQPRTVVTSTLAEARAMREQSRAVRVYAREARERALEMHEANAARRARLDLVAAAWELHRSRWRTDPRA